MKCFAKFSYFFIVCHRKYFHTSFIRIFFKLVWLKQHKSYRITGLYILWTHAIFFKFEQIMKKNLMNLTLKDLESLLHNLSQDYGRNCIYSLWNVLREVYPNATAKYDSQNSEEISFKMDPAADIFWTLVFSFMLVCAISGNLIVFWIVLGIKFEFYFLFPLVIFFHFQRSSTDAKCHKLFSGQFEHRRFDDVLSQHKFQLYFHEKQVKDQSTFLEQNACKTLLRLASFFHISLMPPRVVSCLDLFL